VAGSLSLPAASIPAASIAPYAGIRGEDVQHVVRKYLGQTGTAATVTIPIHVVKGATAILKALKAGSIVANVGAATVTIDLKKNGASILTAVITLNSANTARICVDGTFSSTALVAGDFLELVVTATAGGGTLATGLLVDLLLYEDSV
jgi:hypothetical protein